LEASALNRIVIEALHQAGLPAVAFPASAAATGEDGQVKDWDIGPIDKALAQGLLPLVYGDVAFDTQRGGTIFSTEDIFNYLAHRLKPQRILIAGLEEGVYADYPENAQLLPEISPDTIESVAPALGGAAATDVTGGMASKVKEMLALVQALPGLEVQIFSGVPQEQVFQALLGAKPGTCLYA
jgi:isopentenyl phosphate kinase